MRLVVTDPAAADLESIIDYIALDSPAAAEKVFRAIKAAMTRPLDFPESGRVGRLAETRELWISSLPYVIVYRRDPDVVTVIAVFHGARDLGRALRGRRGE